MTLTFRQDENKNGVPTSNDGSVDFARMILGNLGYEEKEGPRVPIVGGYNVSYVFEDVEKEDFLKRFAECAIRCGSNDLGGFGFATDAWNFLLEKTR